MTTPESNSIARSPLAELRRQRRKLFLVRIRLLFRKIVGADALTTWGSVALFSVAAGGLGTCVSSACGFEVGQSLLIGLAAMVFVGFVTLTCAGFGLTETLIAQKGQLEAAIAELIPAVQDGHSELAQALRPRPVAVSAVLGVLLLLCVAAFFAIPKGPRSGHPSGEPAVRPLPPLPQDRKWENLSTLHSMALPACPKCNKDTDWKYDYRFSAKGYCSKCGTLSRRELSEYLEAGAVLAECPNCGASESRWFRPETRADISASCSNCNDKHSVASAGPDEYSWDREWHGTNRGDESGRESLEELIKSERQYIETVESLAGFRGISYTTKFKVGYVCNNCGAKEILDINKCQLARVFYPKCNRCQHGDMMCRKLIVLYWNSWAKLDGSRAAVFVSMDFK